MRLRIAQASDLEAILALESESFDHDRWGHEQFNSPNQRTIVADEKGTLVGYSVTSVAGETGDLYKIVTAPHVRRTGIAHALMSDALIAARIAGATTMLLEVSTNNPGGIAFYEAEGFEVISTRKKYYRDGSDALVMANTLTVPNPEESDD